MYIRGILLMRVASVGCFPGAWRRGSWHFQVVSLHLQSSMDLLFVRFTLFFLSEQAQRAAYAARGAKRLVCTYQYVHTGGVHRNRQPRVLTLPTDDTLYK